MLRTIAVALLAHAALAQYQTPQGWGGAAPSFCPAGWEDFSTPELGALCIQTLEDDENWVDALRSCRLAGARLCTVTEIVKSGYQNTLEAEAEYWAYSGAIAQFGTASEGEPDPAAVNIVRDFHVASAMAIVGLDFVSAVDIFIPEFQPICCLTHASHHRAQQQVRALATTQKRAAPAPRKRVAQAVSKQQWGGPPLAGPVCPGAFVNGACVLFGDDPMSLSEAFAFCANLGLHLCPAGRVIERDLREATDRDSEAEYWINGFGTVTGEPAGADNYIQTFSAAPYWLNLDGPGAYGTLAEGNDEERFGTETDMSAPHEPLCCDLPPRFNGDQ